MEQRRPKDEQKWCKNDFIYSGLYNTDKALVLYEYRQEGGREGYGEREGERNFGKKKKKKKNQNRSETILQSSIYLYALAISPVWGVADNTKNNKNDKSKW